MKTKEAYCKRCDDYVLAQADSIAHIFHFIMTIITGGFWLVIWLLCGLCGKPYRCTNCGKRC